MKFTARTGTAALLLAALVVVGGCAGYRDGTMRTAGEFTDDVSIQSQVKLGLLNDPDIKGFLVKTDVYQGVVTLTGRVSSHELKQRAVAIAGSAKGVREVDDRLTVVTE